MRLIQAVPGSQVQVVHMEIDKQATVQRLMFLDVQTRMLRTTMRMQILMMGLASTDHLERLVFITMTT